MKNEKIPSFYYNLYNNYDICLAKKNSNQNLVSSVCLMFVMYRICYEQCLLCIGFIVSRVCYVYGLLCLVFVMSRVGYLCLGGCYIQDLLCLVFVMSSVCYVQYLLCLVFVMSSVCYVQRLFVQGLLRLVFVCLQLVMVPSFIL